MSERHNGCKTGMKRSVGLRLFLYEIYYKYRPTYR